MTGKHVSFSGNMNDNNHNDNKSGSSFYGKPSSLEKNSIQLSTFRANSRQYTTAMDVELMLNKPYFDNGSPSFDSPYSVHSQIDYEGKIIFKERLIGNHARINIGRPPLTVNPSTGLLENSNGNQELQVNLIHNKSTEPSSQNYDLDIHSQYIHRVHGNIFLYNTSNLQDTSNYMIHSDVSSSSSVKPVPETGIFINDSGSKFGTFLNGIRLSSRGRKSRAYELFPNDIIQLGQYTKNESYQANGLDSYPPILRIDYRRFVDSVDNLSPIEKIPEYNNSSPLSDVRRKSVLNRENNTSESNLISILNDGSSDISIDSIPKQNSSNYYNNSGNFIKRKKGRRVLELDIKTKKWKYVGIIENFPSSPSQLLEMVNRISNDAIRNQTTYKIKVSPTGIQSTVISPNLASPTPKSPSSIVSHTISTSSDKSTLMNNDVSIVVLDNLPLSLSNETDSFSDEFRNLSLDKNNSRNNLVKSNSQTALLSNCNDTNYAKRNGKHSIFTKKNNY